MSGGATAELPILVVQGASTALAVFTLSSPLASTAGVAAMNGPLRRLLPPLFRLLHGFAAVCQSLRMHDRIFVLLHAISTYACGDMLVQLARHSGGPIIAYQPMRTVRNSAAGVLADAIPFYYWSSLLSGVKATTGWLPAFVRESAAALIGLKVTLHIVLFQTVSNALYLISHSLLSQSGWRGAIRRLRSSLWRTCLVAAVSFGIGGPLVYALPSVLAQSALRNVGVLAFSFYLALIATE